MQARSGAAHGTVLVADHQTAGRGRLGRSWQAPPGSALLCSILLRPEPTAVVHGAVWAVALAAQSAVAALTGVTPELKWPNDLMVGERKLAGVLAEGVTDRDDPLTLSGVVVGIGLNVGWAEPPRRRSRPAPSRSRSSVGARSTGTSSSIASSPTWRRCSSSGPPTRTSSTPAYRSRLDTLGRAVRVDAGRPCALGHRGRRHRRWPGDTPGRRHRAARARRGRGPPPARLTRRGCATFRGRCAASLSGPCTPPCPVRRACAPPCRAGSWPASGCSR